VREAIDDADDVLVAPFAGLVDGSHGSWVRAACRRSSPSCSTASGCRSWPASRGDELDPRRRATSQVRFGEQADFAIGVEEELILVDAQSRALSHAGVEVLARMAPPTPRRASRTPTPTRR
jgi:hypothetical protein